MPRNIETVVEVGSDCEMGDPEIAVEKKIIESMEGQSPNDSSEMHSVIIRQKDV